MGGVVAGGIGSDLGCMSILRVGDEFFILRRTFCLVRVEKREDQELVQLYLRRDLIRITEAEVDSAKRKGEEPGSEEEKQQGLNDAVFSWMADELTHPILETRFWVSDMSFPIAAAGDAVADLNQGLNDLLTQRAESFAEWAGGPIVLDGPVAGITANLVLEPIAEPLTKISEVFWTAGLVIAFTTGNLVLAIGCAKALAKEVIKRMVGKCLSSLWVTTETSATTEANSDSAATSHNSAVDEWRLAKVMQGGGITLSDETIEGRNIAKEILEDSVESDTQPSPAHKVGSPVDDITVISSPFNAL
jgi:hypothetical protein